MDKTDRKIERLHPQVVRAIALDIIRSAANGGEKTLPTEMELSQQLQVSRNVVREAIKVLISKGLIEVRPKTGTRIRPRKDWKLFDPDVLAWQFEVGPNEKYFRDLYDIRAIVEPAAAERAASRATPDEVVELDRYYERMVQTIEDIDSHVIADFQFHSTIINACQNELLRQIYMTYSTALQASFRLTSQIPGGRAACLPFHRAIADAIRCRNNLAARTAMEQLLVAVARDIDHVLHTHDQ
jgi:GntR family transcriptional regulator, galactonate operon transcriptional repressor